MLKSAHNSPCKSVHVMHPSAQCQHMAPRLQAVEAQMSSLEPADDGFVGFMDAETATFASRIRRLMRDKVEELQASSPTLDSGMLPCIFVEDSRCVEMYCCL